MNIHPKQFIAPAGAVFALFSFILPWFNLSVIFLGSQRVLGIQSGLLAWLVASMAAATLAVSIVVNFIPPDSIPSMDIVPKNVSSVGLAATVAVIGISGCALFLMLIIAFFNTGAYGFAAVQLSFGWYGSFLGFMIAIAGAFFLSPGAWLPAADRLTPMAEAYQYGGNN